PIFQLLPWVVSFIFEKPNKRVSAHCTLYLSERYLNRTFLDIEMEHSKSTSKEMNNENGEH
ncbi:hypothetical protein, partial [Vibrio penaeicida]